MMKTKKLMLLTVGMAVMLLGAGMESKAAGIKGSVHDFSLATWNTSRHTLCGVCHSMHNTDPNKLVPLWNHETSASVFTMYSSATLNATMDGQPTGVTLACLSCHDGVTAINAYGGSTNGAATNISSSAQGYVGLNLTLNHPVSFDYRTAISGGDALIRSPDATPYPTTGITSNQASLAAYSTLNKAMLGNKYRMECTSCHDVHKQRGGSGSSSILLVQSSAYGDLCLMCHIK
ncbi:MAG: cytochrome C [Kiritimatiellaeota bacterium]|nr:cytochrome C [Kiritimatiellota bacterium]